MPLLIGTDGFSLPEAVAAQTTAILGIRGSGKTNTAVVLTEELLDAGHQVVIIDPLDVWWGLKSSAAGDEGGYPVVVLGGPHGDLPLAAENGRVLADFVVERRMSAVLSLRHLRKGEQRRFVTDFCEHLYHRKGEAANRTPTLVILDEASTFVPQKVGAQEARMVGAVEDLVRRGRAAGIGVVAIDQRAASVNKDVLTQLEVLVAHRHTSPQDRRALEEWVKGHDTAGVGARFLEELPSLGRGQAYVWSPTLDVFEKMLIRARRTYDSSRTPEAGDVLALPERMASLDLAELREHLAETVAAAEENDPKRLKGRIAELEKRLTGKGDAVAPGVVENLTDAVFMRDVALSAAQASFGRIEQATAEIRDALAWARANAAERTAGFDEDAYRRNRYTESDPELANSPKAPASPERISQGIAENVSASPNIQPLQAVSKPQQRILNALASYESFGSSQVDRTAVCAFAGFKPGSGHVNNVIGSLRTSGLVDYPSGGVLHLTDAGRAAAVATSTRSLQDVHDRWLSICDGPQQRVLRALLNLRGRAISRKDLAQQAGFTPDSGHYNNVVGSLKTLGAAEYPQKGHVQASALLFPAGLK